MSFVLAVAATLAVPIISASTPERIVLPNTDPDAVCVTAVTTMAYFLSKDPDRDQMKSVQEDLDFSLAFYLGAFTRTHSGNDLIEVAKSSRTAFLALPTETQTRIATDCLKEMQSRREAAKAAILQK